jgi:hypothetical protein
MPSGQHESRATQQAAPAGAAIARFAIKAANRSVAGANLVERQPRGKDMGGRIAQ